MSMLLNGELPTIPIELGMLTLFGGVSSLSPCAWSFRTTENFSFARGPLSTSALIAWALDWTHWRYTKPTPFAKTEEVRGTIAPP